MQDLASLLNLLACLVRLVWLVVQGLSVLLRLAGAAWSCRLEWGWTRGTTMAMISYNPTGQATVAFDDVACGGLQGRLPLLPQAQLRAPLLVSKQRVS